MRGFDNAGASGPPERSWGQSIDQLHLLSLSPFPPLPGFGSLGLLISRANAMVSVPARAQDLIKLRAEKEGYNGRLARLRAQNESIVQEISALRAKFGQSVQLLRKYQVWVRK